MQRSQTVKLQHCSWPEVEAYLRDAHGVFIATGSTEQHGPSGPIGTDALCADAVACRAAELAGALVAPPLAYTPAQFNMRFPGTVSVSARTFAALFEEIVGALLSHGFKRIYVLNGHGANLAPLAAAVHDIYATRVDDDIAVRVKSWWDFAAVNALRDELYGHWEGMHATPSEIAITQHLLGEISTGDTNPLAPPAGPLSAQFIADHSGDKHPPAARHRHDFPDGRVGSDSSLARPQHGAQLLELAAQAAADDFMAFARSA